MSNEVTVKLLSTKFKHPESGKKHTPGETFDVTQEVYDAWESFGIFELLGEAKGATVSPKSSSSRRTK